MNYKTLKDRHRNERGSFPQGLSVRIHRALSWLQRAEQESADVDAQFLFLWIAFNSAYSQEIPASLSLTERRRQRQFWKKLIALDKQDRIYEIVWEEFPKSIRLLKDNQFVFESFWHFQRGEKTEEEWKRSFANNKRKIYQALARQNTAELIELLFGRLYTLRNQLVHGGATWNGSVNRPQLKSGCQVLSMFVPAMLEVMLDNPNEVWGDEIYPVVT